MPMKSPSHPIWSIVRFTILLMFLVVFAWINASEFDETEAKMIAEVMLLFAGMEGVIRFLEKKKDQDPK